MVLTSNINKLVAMIGEARTTKDRAFKYEFRKA